MSTLSPIPFAIGLAPPSPSSRRSSGLSYFTSDSPKASGGTATPTLATTPTANAQPRRCALKLSGPTGSPPLSLGSSPVSSKDASLLLQVTDGPIGSNMRQTPPANLKINNPFQALRSPISETLKAMDALEQSTQSTASLIPSSATAVKKDALGRVFGSQTAISPSAMYSNNSNSLSLLLGVAPSNKGPISPPSAIDGPDLDNARSTSLNGLTVCAPSTLSTSSGGNNRSPPKYNQRPRRAAASLLVMRDANNTSFDGSGMMSSPLSTTLIYASPPTQARQSCSPTHDEFLVANNGGFQPSDRTTQTNCPDNKSNTTKVHSSLLLGAALSSPVRSPTTGGGSGEQFPSGKAQSQTNSPAKVASHSACTTRGTSLSVASPPYYPNSKYSSAHQSPSSLGTKVVLSPPMMNNNDLANLLGGYGSGHSSAIVSPVVEGRPGGQGDGSAAKPLQRAVTAASSLLPNDCDEGETAGATVASPTWPPPLFASRLSAGATKQGFNSAVHREFHDPMAEAPSSAMLIAPGPSDKSDIPPPSPTAATRQPSRTAQKLKMSPSSMPYAVRHTDTQAGAGPQIITFNAKNSALLMRPAVASRSATPRQLSSYERDSIIKLKILVSESYKYQRQLLWARFDRLVAKGGLVAGRGPSPHSPMLLFVGTDDEATALPVSEGEGGQVCSELSLSVPSGEGQNQLFQFVLNGSGNPLSDGYTSNTSPCTCDAFGTPRKGCCSESNNESVSTVNNSNTQRASIFASPRRLHATGVESEAVAKLKAELKAQQLKLREEYMSLRAQVDTWWADEVRLAERGELGYRPSLASPPTIGLASGARVGVTSPPKATQTSSSSGTGALQTGGPTTIVFGGLSGVQKLPSFFLTKTSIDAIYEKIRQKFTPMLLWDDLDVLAIDAEEAASAVAKAKQRFIDQQRAKEIQPPTLAKNWPLPVIAKPALSPAETTLPALLSSKSQTQSQPHTAKPAAAFISIDTELCHDSLNENPKVEDGELLDSADLDKAFAPLPTLKPCLLSVPFQPSAYSPAPVPSSMPSKGLSSDVDRYRRVLGTPPYALLSYMDKVHEQRMFRYYEI